MAVGAVVARILTQYSDKGSKAAQKDIAKLQKRIDAFGKKALKNFALASAAAGAFAVKIGVDAVQGAAADEKAQTSLAMAIRNSTSATEEAITANTKFLDQLELQVAVDNEELIPALQRLTTATGDLSQAQNLLVLSTDIAVASGKDLGAVSAAISKAINGQFGALTKLGLPIDATALKQKDLNKILSDFADISQGQASAAANTYAGRLKVLQLSFNQVLDKLGYALMPLVLEFTEYLTKPGGLLDALDEWIETNEKELQESLRGVSSVVQLLIDNGDNLTTLLTVLLQISTVLNTSIFGLIKWGELLLVAGSAAFVLRKLTKVFGGLNFEIFKSGKRYDVMTGKAAAAAKAAEKVGDGFDATKTVKSTGLIRTAINTVIKRWKVLTGLFAAGLFIGGAVKTLLGPSDSELLAQMQAQAKKDFQEEKAKKEKAKLDKILYNNELKLQIQRDKAAAEATRKQAIRDAQELKAQKLLAAQKKQIKDLGIKGQVDEEDPKQLNAAIALLERQKEVNLIDKARLERMKEEVLLLKVRNDLALRYDDILKALADNQITTKEVQILALKWGVTNEAVNAYLLQLKIIEDGTISDSEVVSLAKSWGSTQAQAAQYLDFFQALNDGILSDSEIEKLKSKWKLTEQQVRQYADFVGVVNDGKLTDNEIVKLKDKWKLTTDQVVAYILKIGSPVSYNESLLTPAQAATIGWKNALDALLAYQAALAGKGYGAAGQASADSIKEAEDAAKAAEEAIKAADAASAAVDAAIKSADEILAKVFGAKNVPSLLAAQESGTIGAASIGTPFGQAGSYVDSIGTPFGQADEEERRRFRAMRGGTLDTAASIGTPFGQAGTTNVTVNVQGSVSTQQDLVAAIRQGLLQDQVNGKTLTVTAI